MAGMSPLRAVLALAAVLSWVAAAPARADPGAFDPGGFDPARLADGGYVVMYRHALAPGTGDPEGFSPGDCATQRNLNEAGREQARAIGDALRAAGVREARVLTSRWCRARETARLLGFGAPEELAALDSFFRRSGEREPATDALRGFIAGLPPSGPLVILVSHQVNVTALTGIFPASGEGVVLDGRGGGPVSAVGRLPAP